MTIKGPAFFVLIICACGTNAQAGGKADMPDSARHQLEVYFSPQQVGQIKDYLTGFGHIKTARDLHSVFQTIDKIYNGLADSLSARQGRFGDSILNLDPINRLVTGIHFEHYEGSAMLVNPELAIFKRIAESTPEKCDDDFIAIMLATYGSEKYYVFPKWIKQTWDYGGPSLLGDEIELNILNQIQTTLSSNREFEKELNDVRGIILYDIFNAACYENDSPKIIAELNKVMATIKLTEEEKSQLKNRIEEFKNPPKELRTGCAKKECNCGG
jgi:hypothetical protein